jgi:hypothetical protein
MASRRHHSQAVVVLVVTLTLSLAAAGGAVEFAGGTGEPNDPYQIATAQQLIDVGLDPNTYRKHFALVADIDLDPNLPGGRVFEREVIPWFAGVFDGGGHAIRNLTIQAPSSRKQVGLFGAIAGEVLNLHLENVRISAGDELGAIAGYGWWGRIEGCSVSGQIKGGNTVGGLAGKEVEIIRCRSTARIIGVSEVGGLVGTTYLPVTNSYSTADIQAQGRVGGLVGFSRGWIESCYFAGKVTGSATVGGLVGANSGELVACYAAGRTEGKAAVGPLTGDGGWIHLCFWDTDVMGPMSVQGTFGRTSLQMCQAATFRGWGHDGAWKIDEGNDYPRLAWEQVSGQPMTGGQRPYAGGTGTPDDPYLIRTAEEFAAIAYNRDDFDKCFELMADLDLTSVSSQLIPIGIRGLPFRGVFDGNGKSISGFRYHASGQSGVGVFGEVGGPSDNRDEVEGIVRNLHLVDCDVLGEGEGIGALVADNWGLIEFCTVQGRVAGAAQMGGLAGRNYGQIVHCHCDVTVDGLYQVGGVAGFNQGTLCACSSEGSVSGTYGVGGLVGNSNCGGAVVASYSLAAVEGSEDVGGLIGTNCCSATITASYASGPVKGQKNVGGLTGGNDGVVYLSYWCIDSTGQSGSAAGTGKTVAQMKQVYTFRGWGAEGEWTIRDGQDFPRLAWEEPDETPFVDEPRLYGGGSGTPDDPYRIRTAGQLALLGYFRSDFDKHFVLAADIDMSAVNPDEVLPIGLPNFPFTGVFNGNGHSIRQYRLHRPADSYVGLFGYISGDPCDPNGHSGVVRGLRLTGCDIFGSGYVGGLVASNHGSVIGGEVEGTVATGKGYVGGMAGMNASLMEACVAAGRVEIRDPYGGGTSGGLVGFNEGTVRSSSAACELIGEGSSGGLVGENRNLIILSSSHGNVHGGDGVGGLAGYSYSPGRIEACWSDAGVTGNKAVGGLAGGNTGTVMACYGEGSVAGNSSVGGLLGGTSKFTDVAYCYSAGAVQGQTNVGGLIGSTSDQASVYLCYWDTDTSGIEVDSAGKGKSSGEMMAAATFLGWDEPGYWTIDDGWDRPCLAWENAPGRRLTRDPNTYGGGTGEPNDPYQIRTARQFARISYFRRDFDKSFVLLEDVDLGAVDGGWLNPIGTDHMPFTGTFEGGFHCVRGFQFVAPGRNAIGLFARVGGRDYLDSGSRDPNLPPAGVVQNLRVEDVNVHGCDQVGGLAGWNNGVVANCAVSGRIEGRWDIGGIVGYNMSLVTSSRSAVFVSGQADVGGIAGQNLALVCACYSQGEVHGETCVGGLAGTNWNGGSSREAAGVEQSYFAGLVRGNQGQTVTGALIGQNRGSVAACFWDREMTDQPDTTGSIGLSTAEMKIAAFFLDAGWDFENIWTICEGRDYPRLRWEQVECGE